MLRHGASTFLHDSDSPLEDRSVDFQRKTDPRELRAELDEYLSHALMRLQSLADALSQCEVEAEQSHSLAAEMAAEAEHVATASDSNPEVPPPQEAQAGSQSRQQPAAEMNAPAVVATHTPAATPAEPANPIAGNAIQLEPNQADANESSLSSPSPVAPQPLSQTPVAEPGFPSPTSAAGGESSVSEAANFSSPRSDGFPTGSDADPTDRLAAIKLRLAKQIENV